jgi:hypothetical protein
MDDEVGLIAESDGYLRPYGAAWMSKGSVRAVIEIRGFSSGCPYVTIASVKRSLVPGVNSDQKAAPTKRIHRCPGDGM